VKSKQSVLKIFKLKWIDVNIIVKFVLKSKQSVLKIFELKWIDVNITVKFVLNFYNKIWIIFIFLIYCIAYFNKFVWTLY